MPDIMVFLQPPRLFISLEGGPILMNVVRMWYKNIIESLIHSLTRLVGHVVEIL